MVLIERTPKRARLECTTCGAHMIVSRERCEVIAEHTRWVRCTVCGIHSQLEPAAAPARELAEPAFG